MQNLPIGKIAPEGDESDSAISALWGISKTDEYLYTESVEDFPNFEKVVNNKVTKIK